MAKKSTYKYSTSVDIIRLIGIEAYDKILKEAEREEQKRRELNEKYGNSIINNATPKVTSINDWWLSSSKPPIESYLPMDVIQQLERISSSARLMNRPTERYKLQQDILRPYGFIHLASGTNRRTFYCVNDPTIVLKLASDRVGRSDNLAEVKNQELLKPLCPKIYHVLPTGLLSLQERVETMSWEQFVQCSDAVFNIIMILMYNGYALEDVGTNFFKNWGLRYFTDIPMPVILDFPYVYQVDWSKLRCTHVDPETGIKCDGYIDYDYDRGMNELVCVKCGARYSARQLAKDKSVTMADIINDIDKKGTCCSMSLLKASDIKVTLVKGGKEYYYTGEDGTIRPKKPEDNEEETKKKVRNNNESNSNKTFYPKAVKNEIIGFLRRIENQFGKEQALELADKLGIVYFTRDRFERKNDKKSDYKKEQHHEIEVEVKEEAKHEEEEHTQAKLEIPEGNKYIDEETSLNIKNNAYGTSQIGQVLASTIRPDEYKELEKNEQTTNLYPVKPKTTEEIEAQLTKSRNENVAMGIVGEPLVATMKKKEFLPKLAKEIQEKFDYKVYKKYNEEIDQMVKRVANEIQEYILPKIKDVFGANDGVHVVCRDTYNERQEEVLLVEASRYGSPLFSVAVYVGQELPVPSTGSIELDDKGKELLKELEGKDDSKKVFLISEPMINKCCRYVLSDNDAINKSGLSRLQELLLKLQDSLLNITKEDFNKNLLTMHKYMFCMRVLERRLNWPLDKALDKNYILDDISMDITPIINDPEATSEMSATEIKYFEQDIANMMDCLSNNGSLDEAFSGSKELETKDDSKIRVIYKNDDSEGDNVMEDGIKKLIDSRVDAIDLNQFYNESDARNAILNFIVGTLKDNYGNDMTFPQIVAIAKDYIENHFIFDKKEDPVIEQEEPVRSDERVTTTAIDEL